MTAESQSRRAWLRLRGRPSGATAPTDPDDRLAVSYAYCAALMRDKARTFAFATRWFPADLRRDIGAIYGFFRTIDDLVDERPADSSPDSVRQRLNDWREWLHHPVGVGDPVRIAVADLLARRALPIGPLLELIDGCESDLDRTDIRNAAELDRYCYEVAGTVGVTMAALLGATTPAALEAAGTLGKAMQRTNILRDIAEDGRRGRVYLPADALAAVGLTRHDVLAARLTPALRRVIIDQIALARREYADGLAGVPYLPPRARLPIVIAGRLYERILTKIEQMDYDVFRARAATSASEKLWVALRLALTTR